MQKQADLKLQLLIQLSRPYYTDQRWNHIQLVLRQAQDIKQQPLTDLLKAIIYMHDSLKKRVGQNDHLRASAILAGRLLKNKYSKLKLRRIVQAIKLHSPDYRQSKKNFSHSSPLALLLALADDSNNLRRDPDLSAMISVKYLKQKPLLYDTALKGLQRHKLFFGPISGHPGLKYYKDRWNLYARLGIDNILNYPLLKYKIWWDLINKDTKLPDIDILTKKASVKLYKGGTIPQDKLLKIILLEKELDKYHSKYLKDFPSNKYAEELTKHLAKLKRYNDPNQTVFVYLDKLLPVGISSMVKSRGLKDTGYIHSVFVSPLFRGKKIGTDLFKAILKRAKQRKMKHLLLGYITKNPSRKFYDKLGYKPMYSEVYKEL